MAFVICLIFPCTALVNNYFERLYLDNVYHSQLEKVDSNIAVIDNVDIQKNLNINTKNKSENKNWIDSVEEKIGQVSELAHMPAKMWTDFNDKIDVLFNQAERSTDNLTMALAILIITTFIIPLGMLFIFANIISLICRFSK